MAGPFFDVGTQTVDFREKEKKLFIKTKKKKVGRNLRELKNLTIDLVNQPLLPMSSKRSKIVNTRNACSSEDRKMLNPLNKSVKKECKNKSEIGASKNQSQQRRTSAHSSIDGDKQPSTRKRIRFNSCRRCDKFAIRGKTLCQKCVNLDRQRRPQKLRKPLKSSRASLRINPHDVPVRRSFDKSSRLYQYGARCKVCILLREMKKPACENCQKNPRMVIEKECSTNRNKDTKKITENLPVLRKQKDAEDCQTSVLNKAVSKVNKDEDSESDKEDKPLTHASSDSDSSEKEEEMKEDKPVKDASGDSDSSEEEEEMQYVSLKDIMSGINI